MPSTKSIRFQGNVVNFGVRLMGPKTVKVVKYRGYEADILEVDRGMFSWSIGEGDEDSAQTFSSAGAAEADFKKTIDKDEDSGGNKFSRSRLTRLKNKKVNSGTHKGLKYEIIDTDHDGDEGTTFAVFIEDLGTHQMNLDERGDYNSVDKAVKAAKQAIEYMHANPEEFGVED